MIECRSWLEQSHGEHTGLFSLHALNYETPPSYHDSLCVRHPILFINTLTERVRCLYCYAHSITWEGKFKMAGWRKWEPYQLLEILLPYLVVLWLASLPYRIGDIARVLFPGWFTVYTPSALLTTLFVIDDSDYVYKFWNRELLVLHKNDDFLPNLHYWNRINNTGLFLYQQQRLGDIYRKTDIFSHSCFLGTVLASSRDY